MKVFAIKPFDMKKFAIEILAIKKFAIKSCHKNFCKVIYSKNNWSDKVG